jgi:hypothetical protein
MAFRSAGVDEAGIFCQQGGVVGKEEAKRIEEFALLLF